jgi:hypothetical protein
MGETPKYVIQLTDIGVALPITLSWIATATRRGFVVNGDGAARLGCGSCWLSEAE